MPDVVGGGSRDRPRSVRRRRLRRPCKPNQCPLMRVVSELQETGALPRRWRLAAAQPTYNPLGRDLTFLSADDVAEAVEDCPAVVVIIVLFTVSHMLVPKRWFPKGRGALPQDLVRTTLLDLGDVREAVLARALREAVLVDAPLVEDGAAERRGDVLERGLTCYRTAEVRQRVPGRVPEPTYIKRVPHEGGPVPGDVLIDHQIRRRHVAVHVVVDNIASTTNPSAG